MAKINLHRYEAFNLRVHDGDTITCDLDLGFDTWLKKQTFRLYGINAPELSTQDGPISRDKLAEWCAASRIVVATLQTKAGSDQREKYGRWLGVLFDEQGQNLNENLVGAGLAKAYLL